MISLLLKLSEASLYLYSIRWDHEKHVMFTRNTIYTDVYTVILDVVDMKHMSFHASYENLFN